MSITENMIKLGKRRPQKVKTSFVLTIPKFWIDQFNLDDLEELEIFMDENKNLVIKAPIEKRRI